MYCVGGFNDRFWQLATVIPKSIFSISDASERPASIHFYPFTEGMQSIWRKNRIAKPGGCDKGCHPHPQNVFFQVISSPPHLTHPIGVTCAAFVNTFIDKQIGQPPRKKTLFLLDIIPNLIQFLGGKIELSPNWHSTQSKVFVALFNFLLLFLSPFPLSLVTTGHRRTMSRICKLITRMIISQTELVLIVIETMQTSSVKLCNV